MNPNEKINLWINMSEAIGVPTSQIQALRGARKGLSEGTFRMTWAGTVDGKSPESAARIVLVRLYANVHLRPGYTIARLIGARP